MRWSTASSQPSANVQATMQQMTAQMQTVIEAAERAAEAIRFDAEEQARLHLAEAQRKADRLTAERVGLISELTDDLVRHAANVRDHSEQMVRALEDAINSVTDKLEQPAMTDPFPDVDGPGPLQAGLTFESPSQPTPPPPEPPSPTPEPPAPPTFEPPALSTPFEEPEAPAPFPGQGASSPAPPPPLGRGPAPPAAGEPSGSYIDLVGVPPPPASAPAPPHPSAPAPQLSPVDEPVADTDPEAEAGGDAETASSDADIGSSDAETDPDLDSGVAVSQKALMHATRLAIAGESREAIGDSLRVEHGVTDPEPIVNQVLGDMNSSASQIDAPPPGEAPDPVTGPATGEPEVPLDVVLYATRRAANGVDPAAIASELRLRYGIEEPDPIIAKVIGSNPPEDR